MLRRSFHAFLLSLPLLGAAPAFSPAFAQEKPKVVTTFTIIADIAANVAGDAAVVESITKPGGRDPQLPADPARHPEDTGRQAGFVETG